MHSEISGKYWKSSKASLLEVLSGKVEYVQGNTNVRRQGRVSKGFDNIITGEETMEMKSKLIWSQWLNFR